MNFAIKALVIALTVFFTVPPAVAEAPTCLCEYDGKGGKFYNFTHWPYPNGYNCRSTEHIEKITRSTINALICVCGFYEDNPFPPPPAKGWRFFPIRALVSEDQCKSYCLNSVRCSFDPKLPLEGK